MRVTVIPIVDGAFGAVTKGSVMVLEDFKVGGRMWSIQTTASLGSAQVLGGVLGTWGDLKRLAVTQIPVEDHQLMLVWKTLNGVIMNVHFSFLSRGIILWIELPWPDMDWWLSCRFSALQSVVAVLISSGGDHGYTLLMRPNKVETTVQCFRMSRVNVRQIFWSW